MFKMYHNANNTVNRIVRFKLPSISSAGVVQNSLLSGSKGSHVPSTGYSAAESASFSAVLLLKSTTLLMGDLMFDEKGELIAIGCTILRCCTKALVTVDIDAILRITEEIFMAAIMILLSRNDLC